MEYLINHIIDKIAFKNSAHAKKIAANLMGYGQTFYDDSEWFFSKYDRYLKTNNLTLNFAVDCYLRMYDNMLEERWKFIKSGKYSSFSFEQVNKNVYANNDIMNYHMNGLVLGQFLWFEQYKRFKFFKENITELVPNPNNYLEIGGGHGLYLLKALELLPIGCKFNLIDISSTSIDLAKGIINSPVVNYNLKNVFDLSDDDSIDFFSMGEVLEHLEEPLLILKKIRNLLSLKGKGFLSIPINSAMIDHIYLFNNAQEIRDLFDKAGFKIITEKIVISEHISNDLAIKHKVPIMYAAFVEGK